MIYKPRHSEPFALFNGRANYGKSSLFNAVLGWKDLLHTSKEAVRNILTLNISLIDAVTS